MRTLPLLPATLLAAAALAATPLLPSVSAQVTFPGNIGDSVRPINDPPADLEGWIVRTIMLVEMRGDSTIIDPAHQYWYRPVDRRLIEFVFPGEPIVGWCPVGEPGWEPGGELGDLLIPFDPPPQLFPTTFSEPTLLPTPHSSSVPAPSAGLLLIAPLALAARRRRRAQP